ncbi:hypothetical protein COCOBI_04-7590 [Coccomyxa sp. Obi]|nr:hypothetical protein COCOBI_04-7590 [Coccomyxa sp. Obi]
MRPFLDANSGCLCYASDVCHYDCYSVDPTTGLAAKQTLLQECFVTDYKFGMASTNSLATIYKQPPPAGCELSVCSRFATQAAVDSYRNVCEHPKVQYAVLSGKGVNYDANCTVCVTA